MERTYLINGFLLLAKPFVAGIVAVAGMSVGCGHPPTAPSPQQPTVPASLSVQYVAPNAGIAGVGTAVVIAGTGFQPGASVTLDGVVAQATVVNSVTISTTMPPHAAGPVDVVVTNPDGEAKRLTAGFTYVVPAATIAITGNTSFAAVGETSQLAAIASYVDGTTRDVTRDVQWTASSTLVATVSANGLLTARALGSATVLATYQPLGPSTALYRSAHVTVTPPGTFTASGRVREPGVGSLGDVRVLNSSSGREAFTSTTGEFSFAGLTNGVFSFTRDGYEGVELDVTRNGVDDVPLQQVIRIAAGASVSPTLAPNDMDYLVGQATHCQPCRLIRITSTTPGTVQIRVTWTGAASVLNVWVNGQTFLGNATAREVVANVPFGVGEIVLYVGKVRAPVGDYVPFTLSTTRIAGQ